MTDFSSTTTEQLVDRWNILEPKYLQLCGEFKEFLIKIEKIQNEMILIQKELQSRKEEPENKKLNLNVAEKND